MRVTVNWNELNHYTESDKVEAFRRSVEIREFCTNGNGNAHAPEPARESFRWVTPIRGGYQTEQVEFDHRRSILVYSLSEA